MDAGVCGLVENAMGRTGGLRAVDRSETYPYGDGGRASVA